MIVFPAARLDVVEAAGMVIPEGTTNLVRITLPIDANTNQTVVVQARRFNAAVPIRVALLPDTGPGQFYDAVIDNRSADPAQVTVNVGLPVNVGITVQVWTR